MKRYAVVMDFYVYAENDEDAKAQAQKVADDINDKEDAKAIVLKITESKFGVIGEQREVK
jgi:hypothetical protein